MDVINKFYSSVSSTVSQLSSVLPGNPISREFEVLDHVANAGFAWKIYNGYKRSTKQEASIFVFEKKQVEKMQKDDRDSIVNIIKRSIVQLTKIRHPQILTVQHPLEESRESIAFAAEPVFSSLANVLRNKANVQTSNQDIPKNYKFHDIEIKYGLLQLSEGIAFLHSDVKLLHRNICPESIIINKQGVWKIFGFDFCILNRKPSEPEPFWPFQEYNTTWHVATQPPLEYLAPEYALISKHSKASDIYSLGMLIYTIYSVDGKPLKLFGKDYKSFKRFATEMKQSNKFNLSCIPKDLIDYVMLMLNAAPEMRPDVHQFTKIPFFNDVGVKTLSYLDSLYQWDNLQKSKFYKGLPQVLQKLPQRVCMYRILPCLVKEFLNPPMIPFVLPNVLQIAENCNSKDYMEHVFVHIKPVMKMREPIQILLVFMQKMELLLKLTPAEDVKTDVLPMVYTALESNVQQIQELCLSIIPTFSSMVDYPAMKNALLPRIKKLCITTTTTSVRVNCLVCIGKLLDQLDKWLVLDEIIPFLPEIPTREPVILMAIVGIYKIALTNDKLGLTKEVMATKIIPFLVPLCIENSLSLSQFNVLVSLLKNMITMVENEHRVKLEQLTNIQVESQTLELSENKTSELVSTSTESQLDFEGFNFEEMCNMKTMVNKIPAQTLSLQDKQRIVQQDNQKYLQPQVKTQSLIMRPIMNKPKDLTATLIDKNLNQMAIPCTNQNNFPLNRGISNTSSTIQWSSQNCTLTRISSELLNSNMHQNLSTGNGLATSLNQLSITSNINAASQNAPNKSSNNILSAEEIMDFLK